MIRAGVTLLSLSVLGQQAAAQGKYKFWGELSADECFRACGDNVAIPLNDEDTRAIRNLIPQQTRVWVGITKNRGQRFWNVGTSEDRFNGPFRWGPNEGDDNEPRAAAVFNSAAFREGKWYDMPNDGREHFCVCEAARWPGAGVCASCAPRPGCRFPDATCESCGQPVCDVILAPVRPGCPTGYRVVRDAGECQRANRALGLGLRYRGTIFANDEPARCYFNRELNFVRWNGRTTSRASPANRELLCIPTEQTPAPAPVPASASTPRPASSPTSAVDVILADVRSGCPSGRRVVESAGECQRANRALGLRLRYRGTIFANDQPARCYLHGQLNFVRWNGRTNSRASPPNHQILCVLGDF